MTNPDLQAKGSRETRAVSWIAASLIFFALFYVLWVRHVLAHLKRLSAVAVR
jgi:hypothetical protein